MALRVTTSAVETLAQGAGSNVKVTTSVLEVVSAPGPNNIRVTTAALEAVAQGHNANTRVTTSVLEVVGFQTTVPALCGNAIPVFPNPILPGAPLPGFVVKKNPKFATIIAPYRDLREVRSNQQSFPLWEFEIPFEVLRDRTQNQVEYLPLAAYTEYMQLVQAFLDRGGAFNYFVYDDTTDDSRAKQQIGVGDGTTVAFTVVKTDSVRTWLPTGALSGATTLNVASVVGFSIGDTVSLSLSDGSLYTGTISVLSPFTVAPALGHSANIYANLNRLPVLSEPIGQLNMTLPFTFFINGVATPANLDSSNTIVTFATAPAVGAVVAADFNFYYLCRWDDAPQMFEEFFKNIHQATIKFHSVVDRPCAGMS